MNNSYLVRVGCLAQIGRFKVADQRSYPRSQRVICRTARGLELGEVLGPAQVDGPGQHDGQLLREVTPSDDLIVVRLQQNRREAYQACIDRLAKEHVNATLLDVEHLFDGQSLYFYFLGPVTDQIEAITTELAEAYEAKAQFRRFAETLAEGCGPDCGTEAATGCTTGTCSTCAVSSACATTSKAE